MNELQNYKIVEGKTQIFGVNFEDLKIIGIAVGIIFVIPSICDIFKYHIGSTFYIFAFLIAIVLFILLAWVGKKKYPGYLMSMISFYSQQPKKITVKNTVRIVSKKEDRE